MNQLASLNRNESQFVSTVNSSPRGTQPERKCSRCGETHRTWSECRFLHTKCRFCGKVGHSDKVCFKKRRPRVHQMAEKDIRDESVYRVEQCGSRDGRPIAFELDTTAAVTLMSENHVPRNVTLITPKSMVRSYTGQSLEITGLFTLRR